MVLLKLLGLVIMPLLIVISIKVMRAGFKKLTIAIKKNDLRQALVSVLATGFGMLFIALVIKLTLAIRELALLYFQYYPTTRMQNSIVLQVILSYICFYGGIIIIWQTFKAKKPEEMIVGLTLPIVLILFMVIFIPMASYFQSYERPIHQEFKYSLSYGDNCKSIFGPCLEYKIYTIAPAWRLSDYSARERRQPLVTWDFSRPSGIFGDYWNRPYVKIRKIVPFDTTEVNQVVCMVKKMMIEGWDKIVVPDALPSEIVILENGSRLFKPETVQYDTIYYDPSLQFPEYSLAYELTLSGPILHNVTYVNTACLPFQKT